MYVLTIANDVDNVFETRVYDDDTDLVSILKSFTPKTLDAIVRLLLGQSSALTKGTYERCESVVAYLDHGTFTQGALVSFLETAQNVPARVERALIELDEYRKRDEFNGGGYDFDGDISAGAADICQYFVSWTLEDDCYFRYELEFDGPRNNIHVLLEQRDQFDTL